MLPCIYVHFILYNNIVLWLYWIYLFLLCPIYCCNDMNVPIYLSFMGLIKAILTYLILSENDFKKKLAF